MKNKQKRVLWLLNHKTLMPYEAKLLLELNFEVFVPKIIPDSPSFRSGMVDFSYDSSLTIPARVLRRLNNFNFYEKEWPCDIVFLINRYFETAFVIPHAIQVKEALLKFEGKIMFRAFGLDNSQIYFTVLQQLYGKKIFLEIAAADKRFWFAQGYEQLAECEPPIIADRAIFLPLGVPASFWETAGLYTGCDKRILFVCPNCVTNPYYAAIYKKFKEDFGDLPHVIVGAQDVRVDDPHVLGFVSDEELTKLYTECALLYYHSTEHRHVHYSPVEAAINGMPVVYYANSLLGRLTPEVTLGRVHSLDEARANVERILNNDSDFIAALRDEQQTLAYKFSHEYCKGEWLRSFIKSGYVDSIKSKSIFLIFYREIKRSLLYKHLLGLSRQPLKPPLNKLNWIEILRIPDAEPEHINITDEIDFSKPDYPACVLHVAGLSEHESWGRWSLGSTLSIFFTKPLPEKFHLLLEGYAYGPNIGESFQVRAGNTKRILKFNNESGNREKSELKFTIKKPSNSITITIPEPTVPPNDIRAIGLGLCYMKIIPIK